MSNREVIEQVYEAFHRLDLDGVLQLADQDVVIEQADALPWGGRYVGHAGITEFVTKLVGEIDSKVTTNELFEAGDKVVQVGRTTGVRPVDPGTVGCPRGPRLDAQRRQGRGRRLLHRHTRRSHRPQLPPAS